MPSLKDLRNRISSVRSTKKITSAMKMVAAAKLKRAQDNAEKTRPYAKKMSEIVNSLVENNKSKPRIPFGSLVELGILKPGTVLFDPKKKFNAKVMVDGSIKHKESEGSIHKVAAKIMGTESYNGWTYWYCNINGSTVLIDSLRQKFISQKRI